MCVKCVCVCVCARVPCVVSVCVTLCLCVCVCVIIIVMHPRRGCDERRGWGAEDTGSLANPGQAVTARAKRGKRGVLFAAPGLWLLPSHASGHVAPAESPCPGNTASAPTYCRHALEQRASIIEDRDQGPCFKRLLRTLVSQMSTICNCVCFFV